MAIISNPRALLSRRDFLKASGVLL
ncbi:twin-arginine translocation signal domain-containing protein [Candidatus Latescibacterota bacterium]